MHGLSDRLLAVFARAKATRHSLVDLEVVASLGIFDHVPDEHEAIETNVGGLKALERGVVRLYGVVWRGLFSGWWWVR